MTIAEVQKWNQIGQRENVEARWATGFCRLLFAGVSALEKTDTTFAPRNNYPWRIFSFGAKRSDAGAGSQGKEVIICRILNLLKTDTIGYWILGRNLLPRSLLRV
jgi:hypothetical protein